MQNCLVLRYNKTNSDWRHRSALNIFSLQFVNRRPWSSISRQHFTKIRSKIFNDDLDASHRLHDVIPQAYLSDLRRARGAFGARSACAGGVDAMITQESQSHED